MENRPKRRILSLSLSQQGRERKSSRRHRTAKKVVDNGRPPDTTKSSPNGCIDLCPVTQTEVPGEILLEKRKLRSQSRRAVTEEDEKSSDLQRGDRCDRSDVNDRTCEQAPRTVAQTSCEIVDIDEANPKSPHDGMLLDEISRNSAKRVETYDSTYGKHDSNVTTRESNTEVASLKNNSRGTESICNELGEADLVNDNDEHVSKLAPKSCDTLTKITGPSSPDLHQKSKVCSHSCTEIGIGEISVETLKCKIFEAESIDGSVLSEPPTREIDLGKISSSINKSAAPFYLSAPGDNTGELEILQCPLCGKTFDKQQTQISHMKSCALKCGVPTSQLLEALELQQRQAAERRALGLPRIPSAAPTTKKPVPPKKLSKGVRGPALSKMDGNLQLALALSLSLQSNDQEGPCERQQSVPSLDTYGFVSKPKLTSVNPAPQAAATKGKGKVKPTPVLLTRNLEERQRIITEKVAMVLMDDTDTCIQSTRSTSVSAPGSELLQLYHNQESSLWTRASVSPSKVDQASFYVETLRDFVSPSTVVAGSKVLHLSQLPYRARTPPRDSCQDDDDNSVISTSGDGSPTFSPSKHSSIGGSHDAAQSASRLEMELRAKLFSDWAGLVNNATMSDLSVYPREGRDIPAHKIVFFVRCPEVLRDSVKQQNSLTGHDVEVIMWSKTPHAAALAFLEYIYCGSVKSLPALSEDLSCIYFLARQYNVTDLLKYLRVIQKTMKKQLPVPDMIGHVSESDKESSEHPAPKISESGTQAITGGKECAGTDSPPPKRSLNTSPQTGAQRVASLPSERNEMDQAQCSWRKSRDMFEDIPATSPAASMASETDSIYSQQTLDRGENNSRSGSPDLFEEEPLPPPLNQRENVDYLLSFIDKLSPTPASGTRTKVFAVKETLEGCDDDLPESPLLSPCSLVTLRLSPSPGKKQGAGKSVDTKRKHSVSPEGSPNRCDSHVTKRQRSLSNKDLSSEKQPSEGHVELLDITQDSDSDSNLRMPTERCLEEISILLSSSDSSSESTTRVSSNSTATGRIRDKERCGKSASKRVEVNHSQELEPCRRSKEKTDLGSSNSNIVISSSHNENCDDEPTSTRHNDISPCDGIISPDEEDTPYISPIWDGFEDLNYDMPVASQLSLNTKKSEKPHQNNEEMSVNKYTSHSSSTKTVSSNRKESLCETNNKPLCTRSADLPISSDSEICSDGNKSDSDSEITSYQLPARSVKTGNRGSNTCSVSGMLDDSLNDALSNSVLQRAETESANTHHPPTQRDTRGTPVHRVLSSCQEKVTPLANYSAMKTPQLKRELEKYGLKPSLGKRKGKIMLRHIYNELHPWVPEDRGSSTAHNFLSQPHQKESSGGLSTSLSQPSINPARKGLTSVSSSSRSDSSDDDSERVPVRALGTTKETPSKYESSDDASSLSSSTSLVEESRVVEEADEDVEQFSEEPTCKADLPSTVTNFIVSDPELHQKVLLYEPIWIEQLKADLKMKGYRFKMADLMAFLDEKCITFRSAQGGPRTKRSRRKGKTATRPYSQSKEKFVALSEISD